MINRDPLAVPRPRKKARGAYHHGDLRTSLLRATVDVVRRSGPDALTLRDVARRAGVSEAAPYHHFKSKDALLAAAMREGFAILASRIGGAIELAPPDVEERTVAGCVAYVRFAADEPGFFRLLFGAHVARLVKTPEGAAGRGAGRPAILHLRRCVEAFLESTGTRIHASVLERVLWAEIHGVASLVLEEELAPTPSVDEAVGLVEEGVRLILRGAAGS